MPIDTYSLPVAMNNNGGGGDKSPAMSEKALLVDIKALVGDARPPHPEKRLTAREIDALTAISDTFLPSIQPPANTTSESVATFYGTSASTLKIPEVLGAHIASGRLRHIDLLWLLRIALWLLSTWFGSFFFCGRKSVSRRYPYFHKFSDVEPQRREEIVRGWSMSSFFLFRQLFRGIKFLIVFFYFTQLDEKNNNPTWQALGYCGPDPELVRTYPAELAKSVDKVEQRAKHHQQRLGGPLRRALVDMESPRDTLCAAFSKIGLTVVPRPSPGRSKPLLTIRCDAVVVGSGSGGGLVAGVLAQAGYKVLVLEKGSYRARSGLSLLEGPTVEQMYEGSGTLTTFDTGIVILAGSTVGGGSAINWSASLRTPHHVVREWREERGLELFGSDAYEQALDTVCTRMGVQPEVHGAENLNNAALRRGCTELGYPVRNIPRNAPSDHHCGWCCFGCRDGRKQATSETWLMDMAESGNGLVLPGVRATKVLHASKTGHNRKVATGVVFEYVDPWSGKTEMYIVESKVTVVACGALRTPVLLKQSGLRNPNIGKHLHLHPVVMAWGYFADDGVFNSQTSYEGGIMTAMSPVPSTTGYGAVIQTPALHPGMFSALTPWISGEDYKARMTRFSRTAHIFALARDKGEGTVTASGSISYRMAAEDEENLQKGVERVLRILAAAGAAEIGTHNQRAEWLDVKQASWHDYESFVNKASRRGIRDLSVPVCSAHQMGSCRMGRHPGESAVDERGETWEVEGLYVADSSVFPTALGVNPMVTVQAIAYCTAQSVLEVLKRKVKKKKRMTNKE